MVGSQKWSWISFPPSQMIYSALHLGQSDARPDRLCLRQPQARDFVINMVPLGAIRDRNETVGGAVSPLTVPIIIHKDLHGTLISASTAGSES